MLRIKILVLFFLLLFQVKGQNLVPNSSFENTFSLPCSWIIPPASTFSSFMMNWTMPSDGSSDIYSTSTSTSCFSNCLSTSSASLGSQSPRSGNNMCGFFAYGSGGVTIYREYLEVKLTSPLVVGQSYYAEMYVSAGDNMQYGCNNLGMHFSTTEITAPGSMTVLPVTPQIKNTSIITDVNNWVKVSGTFTATTPAEYLIVGNFDDNNATSFTTINFSGSHSNAYYFIDDVLVQKQCAGKDTSATICQGKMLTLSMNDTKVVSWAEASNPGNIIAHAATVNVTPLVNTTYIATYQCGATGKFDVIISSTPEVVTVNINDPGALCSGSGPVNFIATAATTGTGTLSYQWYMTNASGTNSVPVGTNSATYSYIPVAGDHSKIVKVVVTTSATCNTGPATSNLVSLNIQTAITPTVSITTPNNTLCAGIPVTTTFTATATGGGTSPHYQWYIIPAASTGISQPVGTDASTYSTTNLSNGDQVYVELTSSLTCMTGANPYTSNKISIVTKPIPSPVITEGNQTICSPESFTFHAINGTGTSLQWYLDNILIPGATNATYTATKNGSYTISEDNGTCNTTSSLVTLTVLATPIANAGDDVFANLGESVTLNGSGGGIYSWSPGSSLNSPSVANPHLIATQTTTYTLTVSDVNNMCSSTDQMTVFVVAPIVIPNVITVNGDGVNDNWAIYNIDKFPHAVIDVYNRWGNIVWHTEGFSKNWDGTNYRNGQVLPDGTYFYIIKLNNSLYNEPYTGWVEIIK